MVEHELFLSYGAQAIYTLAVLSTGYCWKTARGASKEYVLLKHGMRSLLRDRLIHKCEKCLEGGYCTVEYRTEIEEMYQDYHNLGGNGTVTRLLNKIERLPVMPPKKGEIDDD